MSRIFFHPAHAIFVLLLVLLTTTAKAQQNPLPSGKFHARAFLATAAADKSISLIVLEGDTHSLLKCQANRPDRCTTLATDVEDAVPLLDAEYIPSGIYIKFQDGSSRLCEIAPGQSSPNCRQTSANSLRATLNNQNGPMTRLQINGVETGCLVDSTDLKCTRVRELSRFSGHVVGSFSSPGQLEVIFADRGVLNICEIGNRGSCRVANGLPDLVDYLAVGSARLASSGLSSLVLIGVTTVTTCAFEVSLQKFSCRQNFVSPDSLVGTKAFVLPTKGNGSRDIIKFVKQRTVAPKSKRISSDPSISDSSVRNIENELAFQSLKTEPISHELDTLSKLISFPLEERFMRSHLQLKTDYNSIPEDGLLVPSYFQAWDGDDRWDFDFWSDSYGLYYLTTFGRRSGETREQCIARECDPMYNSDQMLCDFATSMTGYLGLMATAGATITAAITGPGAGAVAATGITITGGATLVVSTLCNGMAFGRVYQCRQGCN